MLLVSFGKAAWGSMLAVMMLMLVMIAAAAGAMSSRSSSVAVPAKDKRVIVLAGSTGSRAVHAVLEAAGVWMHPDTHPSSHNSRIYQQQVLVPMIHLHGPRVNMTVPDWTAKTWGKHLYDHLAPPGNVSAAVQHWHSKMAEEMLRVVPDNASVWSWKHQHALFTLPFIYEAFPSIHVIHQVQDGRDYALSNLQHSSKTNSRTRSPIVQHFVQLLTGRAFTPAETATLSFSEALAQLWALTNVRALHWAGARSAGLKGSCSVVRVEDLCDPLRMHAAIRTILTNARLPHDDAVVARAVVRLSAGGCRLPTAWETAWQSRNPKLAAAVRRIDANMSAALEAFDYSPRTPLKLPEWLEASQIMSQLAAVAKAMAAPNNETTIMTFATNDYERVVGNWLAWAQQGGVNMSRVLIITRPHCFEAVKAVARGTGATVFSLPALSHHAEAGLMENGVSGGDKFKIQRGGVWLERVRAVYELNRHSIPVLQADLDAIVIKDPLPYIQHAARAQPQGLDLVLSKGFYPSEAYHKYKAAGCMGFVYFNATSGAKAMLHLLLREKLRQLTFSKPHLYNDQHILNKGITRMSLAYNAIGAAQSASADGTAAVDPTVTAWQLTTAPAPLRLLYLPQSVVQRTCEDNTKDPNALVAHCQSAKSGQDKEAQLKVLKLWKQQLPATMSLSPPS